MWPWLKRILSSKPVDPKTSAYVRVRVRDDGEWHGTPVPGLPHQATDDWDELTSKEKIKRVPVAPLPFHDGEVVSAGGKSKKRFAVRLTKQKPGVFELDEERAITVFAVARGREAAMNLLSERICGRPCFLRDSKAMTGKSGKWYDGDVVEMAIVDLEKVE